MSKPERATRGWPARRGPVSAFKVAIWCGCHATLLLLPITYGRAQALAFLVSTYVTLQLGLVLGYHRLLSHRAFRTRKWLQGGLALLGTLAGQTGPIRWAALHRHHHRFPDLQPDPHSPRHGFAWAHFVWTLHVRPPLSIDEQRRLTPDLTRDRFLVFCDDHFVALNLAAGAAVVLLGWLIASPKEGLALLVWVGPFRMVCLWHITFLTNSLGHLRGYRNFETADDSRNSWVLGLLALGDGWHNNHHAFPTSAAHGLRWFEVDVTYRLIRALERLALVWDVRHPKVFTRDLGRAPERSQAA